MNAPTNDRRRQLKSWAKCRTDLQRDPLNYGTWPEPQWPMHVRLGRAGVDRDRSDAARWFAEAVRLRESNPSMSAIYAKAAVQLPR